MGSSVNRDTSRLRLGVFGNRDGQHSIASGCGHFLGVNRIGQDKAPMESAQASLCALLLDFSSLVILLDGLFLTTLARQRQNAVVERNFHLLGIDSGQIYEQLEPVHEFSDIDRGHPIGGGATALPVIEIAEYAVDLVLQLRNDCPRLIANDCHDTVLHQLNLKVALELPRHAGPSKPHIGRTKSASREIRRKFSVSSEPSYPRAVT